MRVIRVRTSFPIYLMFASFFGFSIIMSSLRKQNTYQDDLMEFYAENGAENLGNEDVKAIMIRNKRRKRRSFNSRIKSIKDFFTRLNTFESHCRKLVDVGGSSCRAKMDHNKLFCLDEDVFIPSNNCNVYSFGVGEDISFDYEMSKYGCNVYMFDPTVPHSRVNESIYNLTKLHFHQLGLSTKRYKRSFHWDFTRLNQNKNVTVEGVFDTFANIRKEINQEELPIHYLKMDIEGEEWNVLPDIIANNGFQYVKQFAIEIHALEILNKTEEQAVVLLQNMWNVLNEVKSLGYHRVSYSPTLSSESFYWLPGKKDPIPTCGEIFYLKRS